jgi:hypothetical protein
MAYIGKSIESGTFSVLDTSGNTYNGSNTTFNLGTQVGSVAQLLVSHDGVIQKPGTDYTLASGGTQITFTTAPASGASIFIVEISGAVGGPLDSDLNGTELILDADGDTSITADTDDQIDVKIAGADDFQFTANTFTAQSGSTITTPTLGVGNTKDLGVGLHIKSADTTASAVSGSADELVIEGTGNVGMTVQSANDGVGNIYFGDVANGSVGRVSYNHSSNLMSFNTNAAERMSISSDGIVKANTRIVIDNDVASGFKLNIEAGGNSETGIIINDKDAASGFTFNAFRRSGTEIGSISRNGTNDAVLYTTSSDYRLKDGIVDKTDGIEKIKLLKPRKFYWKSNTDKTLVDGFIAHEVSDVVPEAISGTKDAVDENGDIIPQGIDQSNLVPLLTAALQEAVTKIEALEARVTTLEG